MKSISFFGASGTVTGSCYQLNKSGNPSLLIDYGMYQGTKDIEALNRVPVPFEPQKLAGVLLTHAHLDHCGRLPMLMQNGFAGKIFMTEPTLDLTEIVLHDAARIAEKDENIIPLYTEDDVDRVLSLAEIVDFNESFDLDGFTVTYREAGHIIGAASIHIEEPNSADDVKSIVFSGDLGNYPHSMLVDPFSFDSADIVVMESTYGGKRHAQHSSLNILREEINAIESDGGTLLIPAFAIERTQEVLYQIKQLKDTAKIKLQTPVFLDSPMAIHVTDVYKRYGGLFNDTFHDVLSKSNPFAFEGLHVLEKNRQSAAIDKVLGPKVIIAGSGMMTGGRILKHAQKYLSKASTRILFVGYQGDETLGRAIREGNKNVKIMNLPVVVNAHVSDDDSMSAHADEQQLLDWLSPIQGIKKIFLTHGEDESRKALQQKITQLNKSDSIHLPVLNDEVLLS